MGSGQGDVSLGLVDHFDALEEGGRLITRGLAAFLLRRAYYSVRSSSIGRDEV